jgi:hypothetical protein
MTYTVQDIIDGAFEKEPTRIAAAFDHLIGPKIMDALEARKQEIAKNLFNRQEEDSEEVDTEDDNQVGAEDAESQNA